jgi:glyoxylase-like metal-dependent hydrolase (beta-lactamase superfamily II)
MLDRIITPPLAANSYLLKSEKPALIDVGGDAEFLIKALIRSLNPREINYVFLTHSHFDHAAATGDLRSFGCKVIMHEKEYDILKSQGLFIRPFKPDILVRGGEIFKLGRIELEIIHTPGHTPGSICLYESKRRWLFSGDTVFSHGSFGRVDLPGGDAMQLIRSLEKLATLEVDNLYPGHEDAVEGDASEHIKKSLVVAKNILL